MNPLSLLDFSFTLWQQYLFDQKGPFNKPSIAMADIERKSADVNHLEADDAHTQPKALIHDAAIGSTVEHELTAWEAIKAYPTALSWCLVVSLCVVMVSIYLTK